MEVKVLVSEQPQFGEAPAGWYWQDARYWLTRDAVKKEFHVTEKQLTEAMASGIVTVRTTMRINRYNDKYFTVYLHDDLAMLFQELRKSSPPHAGQT
jgi:hypothetical protein